MKRGTELQKTSIADVNQATSRSGNGRRNFRGSGARISQGMISNFRKRPFCVKACQKVIKESEKASTKEKIDLTNNG